MRKEIYFAVLLISACSASWAYWFFAFKQQPKNLHWSFREGLYPGGWGWGNWSLVDGMLEMRDPNGTFSVYFLPFHHGGDFILETKIMFIRGAETRNVEVQLLTRDGDKLNNESGMVLFAIENKASVRHMIKKIDYIYETFNINQSIAYQEWYVIKFAVDKGFVKAFVNDIQICGSNVSFPVGEYHEPHIAVRYGTARFEYVKVLVAS